LDINPLVSVEFLQFIPAKDLSMCIAHGANRVIITQTFFIFLHFPFVLHS